jgi:hypothetical protein
MNFKDSSVDAFISSLIRNLETKETQKRRGDLLSKEDYALKEGAELALRELIEIASAETNIGWERIPFDRQRERTRAIGERLNALGGFTAMLWAQQQFTRFDGSSLERVWHGIGQWKS